MDADVDSVSYGGDDGAGLHYDRRDQSLLVRLHGRTQLGRQDRHDLSTVFRAAVHPVPLRLWHESRQGRPLCRRQPQTVLP